MSRVNCLPFAVSVLLLAGCSDAMVERYCDARLPDSSLVVRTAMDTPVFRNTQSRAEIAQQMLRAGAPPELANASVAMTSAETVQDIQFNLPSTRGLGFACGRPAVVVTLSVKHPAVDIASDLRPGTCVYEQVLQHEQRHLDAYTQHLQSVSAAVKEGFAARYPAGVVLRDKSPDALTRLHNRELEEWLAPMVEQKLGGIAERRAAIDAQEDLAALVQACTTQ